MEQVKSPDVQVGQRLRLTLEGLGRLGECLAHHEGLSVYVFGGIPGEEVEAEVVRRRRRYIAARVVEAVKPSPYRVVPPCPYFWPCTGCQWQHIAYGHQLELKRQMVAEALAAVPELAAVPVSPAVDARQQHEYRNHARLSIGPGGRLGFVNRTTREFISVERCMLMHPWINQALGQLQGRCSETTQLSIRYGINTGDWLIQPRLQASEISVATGQGYYTERLLGRTFRVASPSFFQVNTAQAEAMVELIRERLRLKGNEFLVDAYAGVGTFAVLLAPYVGRVVAIEESASAVRDAQENAIGIHKVELRQGRTEEVLEGFRERPDAVILDPPRIGCHPRALEALGRLAPSRVIYVSCDPEALARDLKALAAGPFRVEEVLPIDMFPQTHHVECIATLTLKNGIGLQTPQLTLASASPRRQELLRALDVPFHVVPADVDEGTISEGLTPEEMARELALRKARQVSQTVKSGLVLGADTLVVLDGQALGKPRSPQEALDMLSTLRGRTHQVITGVAVVDAGSGGVRLGHQTTQVTMRPYTEAEALAFVSTGEAMDKAGAYAVQDNTFGPAERVEGCYLNVVGLPLCTVAQLLQESGVSLDPRHQGLRPGRCPLCHQWQRGKEAN